MSVQPISSSNSFDPQAFFKKIDSNGDGSIDKNEFLTMWQQKGSVDESKVSELFSKIDTNGDGKISQSEMDASMKKMGHGQKPQRPQGPPPSDADQTSATSATGSSSTGSTSSVKHYDKADLNKDGVVSAEERLEYALKQIEDNQSTDSTQNDYNQSGQITVSSTTVQSTFSFSA
jgi:Ca2+-binding EF-hand superfamily protein